MNQSVDNQQRATSTTQEAFKDFNPPQTTDGSYKGKMHKVKATEDFLENKFAEEFQKTNDRLKEAKTRVSITRKGNSLQLQATLPPKPDSDKVTSYQQLISLGIPANLEGLQTAYEEANELGRLLARKQFEWNEKYFPTKTSEAIQQLTGYYAARLEALYFTSHKRTMLSEHSFQNYMDVIKRHLGYETLFNKEQLEAKINTLPPWAVGLACTVAQVIIKEFKLNFKLEIKKPKVESQIRDIPDDATIIATFRKFEEYANDKTNTNGGQWSHDSSWVLYQWCYGMLATYGLRPRELFVNPNVDWWLSQKNIRNTWKVDNETKTGKREVLPFVPEWVELFDLKNPDYLKKLTDRIGANPDLRHINNLRRSIARWLIVIEAGFRPYDLRHACAIRSLFQGMPPKLSADNLGHSLDIHTSIYQKWISVDMRAQGMDETFAKKSEIDLMRDENIQLKLEIERLKIENERYRLGVSFPDILR